MMPLEHRLVISLDKRLIVEMPLENCLTGQHLTGRHLTRQHLTGRQLGSVLRKGSGVEASMREASSWVSLWCVRGGVATWRSCVQPCVLLSDVVCVCGRVATYSGVARHFLALSAGAADSVQVRLLRGRLQQKGGRTIKSTASHSTVSRVSQLYRESVNSTASPSTVSRVCQLHCESVNCITSQSTVPRVSQLYCESVNSITNLSTQSVNSTASLSTLPRVCQLHRELGWRRPDGRDEMYQYWLPWAAERQYEHRFNLFAIRYGSVLRRPPMPVIYFLASSTLITARR